MTYPKMKGTSSSIASRPKRVLRSTSFEEQSGGIREGPQGSGLHRDPSSELTEYEELFSRVIKIMDCFKKHPHVYESLMVILRKREKEQKPIKQVRNEVALLFLNNLDLLAEAMRSEHCCCESVHGNLHHHDKKKRVAR